MSDMSCRHDMCDLCGVRVCENSDAHIKRYGQINSCLSCVRRAVAHLYDAACMGLGVGGIDVNKPCPQKIRAAEAKP